MSEESKVDYSDLKYIIGLSIDAQISRYEPMELSLEVAVDPLVEADEAIGRNIQSALRDLITIFFDNVIEIMASSKSEADTAHLDDMQKIFGKLPDDVDLSQLSNVEGVGFNIGTALIYDDMGQGTFLSPEFSADIVIVKEIATDDEEATTKIYDAVHFVLNHYFVDVMDTIEHYVCDGLMQQRATLKITTTFSHIK